jgi:hypothetical protein
MVDREGLVVDVVDDERVPAEDGGEQVPRGDPVVVHVQERTFAGAGGSERQGERKRREKVWG